jgi:galactokinase
MGAGLSSSAAFELAIARALAAVNDLPWEPITMARYAQRAENEWIGVKCGIMDQLISAAGVKDHAVLIDCRDLSYEAVPLPQHTAIVIMDTNTKRGLVGSAYNERRQQCEDAATILGVKKLRDATLEQLNKYKAEMPDIVYKRAHHVISENARTVAAKEYLQQNNPAEVGKLMRESHRSLAEDFEVSSTALDAMAHIANAHPACYGARMTGAGFGGCAVALIDAKHSQDFVDAVSTAYQKELSLVPNLYVCHAEDGVELKIN